MSRYRCVDAQKAAGFPVAAACTAAAVSTSAYYAWAIRARQGPSGRHQQEAELLAEIRAIHRESAGTYGCTPSLVVAAGRSTASGWSA